MSPRVNLIQDTAANFAAKNPILRAGDMGIETDTGLSKFGDGINSWTALPYYPYDQSSGLFRNQLAVSSGSVLGTIPGRVHPAEQLLKQAVWWIDAKHSSASGQAVTNLGWGGSALNAQLGSTSGADSNDPLYLAWAGENYIYIPGVTGNYMSVPDDPTLDITGDIDIRIQVSLDNWQAEGQNLLAKQSAGNTRSYYVGIGTSGRPYFTWSVDGSTPLQFDSSVATTFSAGTKAWIRFTLDVDNGAGGRTGIFYTSADGIAWTQLGTTQTTSGTTSIFSSTSPVEIGSRNAGLSGLSTGKFHRSIIKNGIDGPTVLDVDCSQITSGGATSFRALTGQTVTIKRSTSGRKSVAVTQPCWLFGTDDWIQVSDNDLLDFGASDSFTAIAVTRVWANPVNFGYYMAKYSTVGWAIRNSGTTFASYAVIGDTNSVSANTNVSGYWTFYPNGVVGVHAAVLDRSTRTLQSSFNGFTGSQMSASSVQDLSNALPLRIGAQSDNAVGNDMEGVAFMVFRRALTAAEISLLTSYYQSRN